MKTYTGEELQRYLDEHDRGYKALSAKAVLDEYIHFPSRRVICVYGLRKTGKATLMEQEMRDINDPEHTLYIRCGMDQYGTYVMQDIYDILDDHKDCRYVFIDEITQIGAFIESSAFLADFYSCAGHSVVVTGSDTYSFYLAERDALFDRIEYVRTTFIPFSDYHWIFGGGIRKYMTTGGCFADVFSKGEDTWEYLD